MQILLGRKPTLGDSEIRCFHRNEEHKSPQGTPRAHRSRHRYGNRVHIAPLHCNGHCGRTFRRPDILADKFPSLVPVRFGRWNHHHNCRQSDTDEHMSPRHKFVRPDSSHSLGSLGGNRYRYTVHPQSIDRR